MRGVIKSLFEKKNLLAFIIGLLAYYKIRTLGTFAAAELIAIAFSIPIFLSNNKWKCPRITKFTIFAFLWLLGTFCSDIYNESSNDNSLKGFFNVLFLITCIPFVAWLVYDSPKRLLFFWLGVGLSRIYNYYFQHDNEFLTDEVTAEIWGIYAYRYIFVALGCILYYLGRRYLSFVSLIGYGFYSLFFESRNVFLMSCLSFALILYFEQYIRNENIDYSYIGRRLWKLAIVGYILLYAVSGIYSHLASSGTLGERAQQKYEVQSSSKLGIASGRGTVLETLYFCIKKPVWGYGSYARDKDNISGEYNSNFKTGEVGNGVSAMVPGHSFIFGAWVYNGILGLLFWIWVVSYLFKIIPKLVLYNKRYLFMNISFILILLWDIFCSPFQDRFLILMTIIPLFFFERYYINKIKYC